MARLFSNLISGREAWKGGSLYLAIAVAMFGVVVFLLFRGHSAGPREVTAKDMSAPGAVAPTPRLVGDTELRPASAAGELAPAPVSAPAGQQPTGTAQPSAGLADQGTLPAGTAILEAMALVRSKPSEIIEARNRLNKVLQMPLTPVQQQTVKSEMAKLAEDWLFGPAAFPSDTLCDTYMVKRGDLLDIIGRRHKVPYEILMQINNIPRPQALQAGRALKVVKGPFHAKVCRSTFTLDLYLQDTYVRSFKVGLGKPGYETPTGLWRVQENGKLIKPTWTDPDTGRVFKASDPDYPLGSRWIALDGVSGAAKDKTGFAIHGTKDPEQIGTAGSRGCIRMYNGDAVLMYNLLVPLYSEVEISD
jgi:LysM repeat protein